MNHKIIFLIIIALISIGVFCIGLAIINAINGDFTNILPLLIGGIIFFGIGCLVEIKC